MNTQVYLSALGGERQVLISAAGNGRFYVKGLPVLRTGTWKGQTYDAELLQHYSDTFRIIRDTHQWLPPVRPKHVEFDSEGQPKQTDARDLLGAWTDLYPDEGGDTLLADAEVNEATATALLQGAMRFVSSELSARLRVGGQDYNDVFSGGAFVEHPAVTGMPWSVVCNAEDFAEATPSAVEPTPQGGESHMSWFDKLKVRLTAGEPPTKAEVAALLADETDPQVAQLAEQAQAEKARADQAEADLAQLRETLAAAETARLAEAHLAAVTASVDALLTERRITPAQREPLLTVLTALRGQEIVTLAEDGSETRTPLAEVLVASLREGAQISDRYFGQESSATPSAETDTAMVERMAKSVGLSAS